MHDINTTLDLINRSILSGMQDAFEGIPLSVGRMSLTCSPDISEKEICLILLTLDKSPQRLNAAIRFMKGDFWNSIPSQYGAKKALIRKTYPDADEKEIDRIYLDWKHCAKIARRWNVNRRNAKWSWNFYKIHHPDSRGGHIESGGISTAPKPEPEDGGRPTPIQKSQLTLALDFLTGSDDPRVKRVVLKDGEGTLFTKGGQTYNFFYDANAKGDFDDLQDEFADDYEEIGQ